MAGTELESNLASEESSVQETKEAQVTPGRDRKWRIGLRLEARLPNMTRTEESSDQWFPAKVQEIDRDKRQILVHYMHWNSRHDEWVAYNSPRLRSVRSSARFDSSSNGTLSANCTTEGSPASSTPTVSAENTPSLHHAKDFKSGDKVMATWKLNRKYPATVISFDADSGNYLVEFYDQVQSNVRPHQIRRMRKDEELSHLNSNGEMKTADEEASLSMSTNNENVDKSETSQSADVKEKPVTPKGRRERKRKFDVKTLLKLRPSSAASSITSSPSSPAASTTTTSAPANRKSTGERALASSSDKVLLTAAKKRQSRNKVKQTATKTDDTKNQLTPKDILKRDISSEKDDNLPALEVSGKRKIKKKKFWDETEAGTSNKTVRQRQQPLHKQVVVPVKNRRRRSTADSAVNFSHKDNNKVKISDTSVAVNAASTTSVTTEQSKENGKLKYLLFDLTSEPRLIAEKMIEGVNIPGPGIPIPIDSSRLPNGWEKRVIQRGIGITKGKWDVFIQNSNGRSFRSKTELQKHLDEHRLPHSVDQFDFSLDDRLKRLRQIWKQYIKNADLEKSPRKLTKKKLQTAATVTPVAETEATSSAESTPSTNNVSNDKEHKTPSIPAVTKKAKQQPELSHELDPYHDPNAVVPNLGVESETGQGLRCSIEKCGKLFRNDRLLQQHVKHYHPDVFDQVIASVTTPVTTAPNTPSTSPPSSLPLIPLNNASSAAAAAATPAACLSTFADEPFTPDIETPNQIVAESKKRKSICIDTPHVSDASQHVTGIKKRKLSLGSLEDEELELTKPSKRARTHDRSVGRNKRGPGRPAKKFSFSESSAASPINNNTSDSFDVALGVNRRRNDSILSVVSSSVAPSEDEDHDVTAVTPGILGLTKSRVLPPTPPTFRLSKRRQAQLLGSSKRPSRRSKASTSLYLGLAEEASLRSRRLLRDDLGQCRGSPEVSISSLPTPSTSGYFPFPSSLHGGSSYPPSEMDTSVTSEHLTTEEVVNCDCRRKEEDGLMIQCDICLCWQHGLCLGIDDEDQVPDKHVCEFCKNPKAGRSSAKYALDQDWLKEGRLPSINKPETVPQGENAFKKLSELMADLANLNKVLHSLRLKLQVASQTNSGKVFMWSMLWDSPPTIRTFQSTTATSTTVDEQPFVEKKLDTNFGKFDPQAVIDKLKMKRGTAATAAGGDPFSNNFCSNNQSYLSNNISAPHQSNNIMSEQLPIDDCQNLWPPHLLPHHQQQQGGQVKPNCDSVNANQTKSPKLFEAVSSAKDVVQQQAITTNGTAAATSTTEENINNFEEFDESKKRSIDQCGDRLQQQQQPSPTGDKMDKVDNLDQQLLEENQLRDSMEVCNEQQLDEVSGAVEDSAFDISLIPTFSEVAQLLPSVIEAMGSTDGAGNGSESPTPTLPLLPPPQPRVLIQEPKRITRDECRLNLLDHIYSVQGELELRLDTIESGLSKIVDEAGSNPIPQTPRTRSMLTSLLRDLSTARTLMWSLK